MFPKTLITRMVCGVLAAAVLSATLGGCTTTTPASPARPAEAVCPPRVQILADALARYRAQRGAWPPALRDLVFADLLDAVMPSELDRYGYAGRPLGVLPDGRQLMLVDGVRQADGSLWCVVESTGAESPGRGGLPLIEVVAVPWATLAAAAQ